MVIRVGMADLAIGRGQHFLRTVGLGSCVGVCLYDASKRVGAMAHVMLPSSAGMIDPNPAKYADTAVARMLDLMSKSGIGSSGIVAKLAGGAQMFQLSSAGELTRIGPRNVEAVYSALDKEKIRIIATDVGGNFGRTIEMSCEDGSLSVHTAGRGVSLL